MFHNTFDWTAVGTLALAAVTLVAVIVAAISLRQTRADIALSRREVEEAHRPALVPDISNRLLDLGSLGEHARAPAMIGDELMVPIKNIGSGPALRVLTSVVLLDAEGQRSAAATAPSYSREVAGIKIGATVAAWIDGTRWTSQASFAIEVTYSDVAGQKWSTTASYLSERSSYEGLDIKRVR